MDDILEFTGDYRWLSNFYVTGYTRYEGLEYPTSEHAYQAAKFTDIEKRREIRGARTPGEAKRLGRHWPIETPDWEGVKISVMEACLENKFLAARLRWALLETKDAYLEEGNHWGDTFWGVCDGRGRNELGLALMRLRGSTGGYGITTSWRDL